MKFLTEYTLSVASALAKSIGRETLALSLLIIIQSTQANTLQKTPHEVVQSTTDRLLEAINHYRLAEDNDPEVLYSAVSRVLEPSVDFRRIARIVMAKYYKDATDIQRDLFAKVFKRNLIATYSRGLTTYDALDIVTEPHDHLPQSTNRIGVLQSITTKEGTVSIVYTMIRTATGDWKVLNLILNGVNLGQVFRNQFAQAVKKSGGDIDQVIQSWDVHE